jgi:hypothetical protein
MNWYLYRCPHCGKLVKRLGDGEHILKKDGTPKKWIKSWCMTKKDDVRLQLVEE